MEVDRDRAWMLLRVAFSAALLWFVLASVGVGSVVSNLAVLPPSVLALAVALAAFNVALSAYKWQLLLAVKDIDLPFRTLFVYYYVGQFFNAFLPTMVGGDGVRIYYLHGNHDAGADAASSVVVERLTGLVGVLAIGGVATVLLSDRLPTAVVATMLLVCVPGVGLLLALLFTSAGRRLLDRTLFDVERFGLGDRLSSVYDAIAAYRHAGRALVPVLAASVLFRLVLVANNYVVAVGLGMDVPFAYFLVFVPLVELLLLVPVSVQGFGVRETTYVYLFGAAGASSDLSLTLGVVMGLVLGVFNNVVGGVVYVASGLRSG